MKDFFKHLRLHYQFFILSGPFLLGGLFSPRIDLTHFLIQFFSVHFFLFGGVTAYNSYWDKDEGPIGGLKHPPKMKRWMLYGSWFFQGIGIAIAFWGGWKLVVLYLISAFFFWLYSSPKFRWKNSPFLSFAAIGIATVICPVFFGFFSFGGVEIDDALIIAAVGGTLTILSLYPLSQFYQISADRERGDNTFAVKYGKAGIKKNFVLSYSLGVLLLSFSFLNISKSLGYLFFILGFSSEIIIYKFIKSIFSEADMFRQYKKIMRIKYLCGLTFSFLMVVLYFLT